ncbi:tegument serine/threonine kinase [Murid herpesvirus 3]|uniref:Tegument serine/threonine kinase n=2 Tax=Murid betaherpesvirus 3 TaxID=2560603 RepID=A0A1P8VIX5_9BETA|nr:tegument serine/threonine kinase [Murine roseolovirus]APZ76298.1 tegument serine/threonine kinase [Murid betaherpesvirus 3]AYH64722.1 tegument serine/threonine kinase [Murid herpesvirus 3]
MANNTPVKDEELHNKIMDEASKTPIKIKQNEYKSNLKRESSNNMDSDIDQKKCRQELDMNTDDSAVTEKTEITCVDKSENLLDGVFKATVEKTSEIESRIESTAESEIQSKFESQTELKIDSKIESKFEPQSESQIDSEIEPETESEIDPDADSKIELRIDSETESVPEPETKTKVGTETEPDTTSKSIPESELLAAAEIESTGTSNSKQMIIDYEKNFQTVYAPNIEYCKCEGVELMCTESLTEEEIIRGICPVCKLINPQLKKGIPTYEEFPGELKSPTLLGIYHDHVKYNVVYLPSNDSLCSNFCSVRPATYNILGHGRYGHIYRSGSYAIKKTKIEEIEITGFISGVIRNLSKFTFEFNEYDSMGLLIPNSICVEHNNLIYRLYRCDLHEFTDWQMKYIDNYYDFFCKIANGLRFLNMKCGISHLDVNAKNIFINHDSGYIISGVLGDYSLAEVHPQYQSTSCIAIPRFKTLNRLSAQNNKICEMYNPTMRPIVIQKDVMVNVNAEFNGMGRPVRHCNLDLCALGNTVVMMLFRLLCEGGIHAAKVLFDNKLFGVGNDACLYHPIYAPESYRASCCRIVAYQLLFNGIFFPRDLIENYEHVLDHLTESKCADLINLFQSMFLCQMPFVIRQPIRRKLEEFKKTNGGKKFISSLYELQSVLRSEDLEKDPYRVFVKDG